MTTEVIDVMASTFETRKNIWLENGVIVLKKAFFKTAEYKGKDIASLEIANEDNTKKVGGTLMGAAVGGALTGGVGAVVGALAGGNKGKVVFIASFHDGNQLMAQCSQKAYLELSAAVKQAEFDKLKPKKNKKDEEITTWEAIKTFAIVGVLGYIVYSCAFKDKTEEPVTPKPTTEQQAPKPKFDPKEKIAEYAVEVMKSKDYPKAFKQFGNAYMKKVNELAPKAALTVAERNSCDRVEVVTFSPSKSTKNEIIWVIDCANKERFWVSEFDL